MSVKARRDSESQAPAKETDSDAAVFYLHWVTGWIFTLNEKDRLAPWLFLHLTLFILCSSCICSQAVMSDNARGPGDGLVGIFQIGKSSNGKGGLAKPSQITGVPRGRNQHLVNMHTCVWTRCVVALQHGPFIYTYCKPTNLHWCGRCISHLAGIAQKSSASLDSEQSWCCCLIAGSLIIVPMWPLCSQEKLQWREVVWVGDF